MFIIELVVAGHGRVVKEVVLLLLVQTGGKLVLKPHPEEVEFGGIERTDGQIFNLTA